MGRLFVGNLSWSAGEAELRAHVEAHGIQTIKATVITDRETGRSRGFGFVEVDGDVQEAISALDGTTLDGRPIRVNEAHERERGPRREPRQGHPDPDRFRAEPAPFDTGGGGGKRRKKGKSRRRKRDEWNPLGW